MDGTQYDMGLTGKIYLCNLQDLGSRYKFWPLAGGYPVGEFGRNPFVSGLV
jgi:hypothetical protein